MTNCLVKTLLNVDTNKKSLTEAASKLDDSGIPFKVNDSGIFVNENDYFKANELLKQEGEQDDQDLSN